MKTNIEQALDWWRSLSDEEKNDRIDVWKIYAVDDLRSKWSNDMIFSSTSTIETIWDAFKE